MKNRKLTNKSLIRLFHLHPFNFIVSKTWQCKMSDSTNLHCLSSCQQRLLPEENKKKTVC